MIYFKCFLIYFQTFPVNLDKKELRFGQNFKKLYSPKIQLDLTYIFFSSPVLIFAPESIHQMAWFPFKNKTKQKQNKKQKTKQKNPASQGGGGTFPLDTPCARQQIIP